MGPVLVVERLVIAERVHQVGLVHDQGPVEELGSARTNPRSMIAFMRGTRIPVLTTAMPSFWKAASNAVVYRLSRSRIR